MFAIGSGGTVVHYDGETWSEMAGPTTAHLGPADVFAVGYGFDFTGVIVHYDGASWRSTSSAALFRGVWGPSSEETYFVGEDGIYRRY